MRSPIHRPRPDPASDTPLGALGHLDLTTRGGMALLRRFDAALRRLDDPAARRAAVSQLSLQWPLADRGQGLMVVPGGALALRRGDAVLACDPASASVLTGEAAQALRRALEALPCRSVVHAAEGLWLAPSLPPDGLAQSATLVEPSDALAAWLPAAAGWTGPALLRWGAGSVLAWEMAPVPGRLALAISVLGEVLAEARAMPRHWWDAPAGDDRYQLLSSGLSAHLDELLGNEVSDALRFALIAHWTDGDDSQASLLADGLGLLPACFATPFDDLPGLQPLSFWPRSMAAMAGADGPCAVFGISPAEAPLAWTLAARQGFLRAAREAFPAGTASLLAEGGKPAHPLPDPLPLAELGADRMARQGEHALAVLQRLPVDSGPLPVLLAAQGLAQACGVPVLVAVPAWGLCHFCDPLGPASRGNAAWFGFAGGLEDLAEAF